MQAKDLKVGDKFKISGDGSWNRELEALEVIIETIGKWNPKKFVAIKIVDGRIKLRPKQEIQII